MESSYHPALPASAGGWLVGGQEDEELLGLARRMLSEEAVRCAITVMRVSGQAGYLTGHEVTQQP